MAYRLATYHAMRETVLLAVMLISISLPSCTPTCISCDSVELTTIELSITEDFGPNGNTPHQSEVIYDFLEGEDASSFTDHCFSQYENVFETYFNLDDDGLSTKGWIDRDLIAHLLSDTFNPVRFEFIVQVYSASAELTHCYNVVLNILDLDDNAPMFDEPTQTVMFRDDNEAIGEERSIDTADDNDEGVNGTFVYELVGDTDTFELVFRNYTNTTRVEYLFLRNIRPLDHEEQPSYNLLLYAREGNDMPNEAVLNIIVEVTDICDEPPSFTTSRYTPNISENATLNTQIVDVVVNDLDNRTVCPLEYRITRVCGRQTVQSSCDTINNNHPFALDSESGQLTLRYELDREMVAVYDVTVLARDGEQSSATATVEITVEDINDNTPYTQLNTLDQIEETQAADPNVFIGHFTVSDADSGRNGQVFVRLLDNSSGVAFESETFKLKMENTILYQIYLNQALDYETQREFHLVVELSDNGTDPRSATFPQTIAVGDSNDHPPVFAPLPPISPLPEDSVVNTHIVHVTANDLDSGNNAHIEYELPESNDEYPHQHIFQIEREFGQILVGSGGMLDYELFTNYTIVVVASNSRASQPLSANITVTIPLQNINDNPPQITLLDSIIHVRENAHSNYVLGQVIATDADNLGALSYSIMPSSFPFSISDDGSISLKGGLDYETVTSYSVSVLVSDGRYETPADITIRVDPVNDERPYFTHNGTYYTLFEEQPAETLVLTVTAVDLDEPAQDLHFSIDDGLHMERFTINSMGEIHTTVILDRETTPNYTLWIRVSDGEFFSDPKEVVIIVEDINDHTPHFINQPYNFMINEHDAVDTAVGTVEVVSLDIGRNSDVRFEILPNSGAYDWFSIDESTGVITSNVILDRESDLFPNPIEFTVRVRDNGSVPRVNTTAVSVTIVDINDNGPQFEKELYIFELREDYPIGRVFDSVVARDADASGNNVTRYSFAEGSDSSAFHIEELTGELSLVSSLDYETSNMSIFDVVATDDGRRDMQTSTTVRIDVTNARDLNLTFSDDFSPHFSVTENVAENHIIASLEVKDNMMNSVDRLIYTLTTHDDMPSPYFGIRKEGYEAYIYTRTHTINREAEDLGDDKTYHLKLNVSDPDTTPDSYGYIVSYLTITILDENDNDPTFVDAENDFYVTENGNAGQQVASFEVRDPDAGNNGTIHLAIDSVVPFNVTHVHTNGQQFAVIRVVSPLDREYRSLYQFSLRVSDQGTPTSRHTTVEINVHIIDENDNDPVFCSPEDQPCRLPFEVREDHVIQQEIARVEATDPDDGTNADIRYEFVPGLLIGSRFSLEPNTGRIILGESLDREVIDKYEFQVRAVDGGNRASTATVIIQVKDVNEYPPVFINSSFTVTIQEDFATGVRFTSLIARDQDFAPNAVIRYTLADRSLSDIFNVNQESGAISLRTTQSDCSVIDYERVNEYKVGIIAYDRGSPRRYSNETLTVQVTNVNEHTPTFDASNLIVLMSENTEVSSTVLTIEAYDSDTGDSLQYSLSTGTPFNWDSENNALILSSAIDYNPDSPTIRFHLDVTDGEKNNQISITVLVQNENNHRPVFETEDSTVTISEDADLGTIVFSVHATDADNATNDAVVYSISAGNVDDTFYINPKAGILQVAQDLDYESVQRYTLTILATDTGEPAMTSEPLHVTIEIENENDEEPIFEEDEYSFTLVENNAEMDQVGCVQAPDIDEEPFGSVVYSMADEGENSGFFIIDAGSGCISAAQIIDREHFPEFQLRVQAQDAANPAISNTVSVNVIIGDINDNAPRFPQSTYLFYILPDHPISEPVGSVIADDPDTEQNALFNYEIITQNSQVEISDSGVVSLTSAIPTVHPNSYSSDVRVSSTVEGDTSFADATIMIIVETDTEHHPRFSQQMYEESVSESVSEGYRIFDASEVVTDEDGTDGLTYSFVQDNEQFALDSETGLLTLQTQLNYEETRSYDIQIQATDTTSRTATATLRVTVEDGNDHAPVFVQMPTNLVLSPIPYTDIELFTVKANDDDVGSQGTVEYSIVQSSSIFSIDGETGIVTNRVNLVTNDSYIFVIRAFDHGSPLKSSNITVHIRIDDQGDPPRFSNGGTSIDISVHEDKNYKTDPEIQGFSTNPVAESYHLVYSNASKDMFSIDVTTNKLVLNSELDYETASQYLLIIEARSMSNGMRLSSFLLVNIIVIDTNDNVPYFPPIPRQLISETALTNTELFTVEAMDDDSGENAEISYVISDGNIDHIFHIDSTTGSVSLVEELDREEISSYILTIRASDGGSPSLRNHTTVFIEVTDVNDNPPIFAQENYFISVYEYPHTRTGDSIIQIVAKDADLGSVNYYLQLLDGTFEGQERNPSSDTFNIDFDTGNITAHRDLDREEIDSYSLRIEARDTGGMHSEVAYLTIKVIDVNDHAPVLTLSPGDVTINEFQPENSLVLDRLVVSDRDTGPNRLVKFSLGESWPAGHFKINPWTGVVRIDRPIEFERGLMEFDGTIFAVDQGVPQKTGSVTVRVFIQDVNNFPPVLEKTHYRLAVSIDHTVGTPITTFNYTDDRDNHFNALTDVRIPAYYNDAFSLFEISNSDNSGILQLLRRPNPDEVGDHCFRIEAIQRGSIPNCPQYIQAAYAHVCVTIHPTNDRPPVFPDLMATRAILENTTINRVLNYSDLQATDADGNSVFYRLSTDNIPFDIPDPSHLILTVTGELNADSAGTSEYTIDVVASDDGFPVKSSTMTLVINIINVNDATPIFEKDSYTGRILESINLRTIVVTVVAKDEDSDEVSYSIEYSGDSQLPFDITSNGDIETNATLDFEMKNSYHFRVKASDGVHSMDVPITIDVVGENEYPPVFRKEVFEFTVSKDHADNSRIGKLEATDNDAGNDGKLLYSFADEIEEQYNVFVINETSGEIFLHMQKNVNIEVSERRKRNIEVGDNNLIVTRTVTVRDSGESPKDDTAQVSITIDKSFFEGLTGTMGGPTDRTGTPYQIIIIVVIAVVGAIVVFVAIIVIALLCRRHLRKRKYKVEDSQLNGNSSSGIEMGPQRFCRSDNNGTSLDTKTTTHTSKLQTGNSASGSEQSYTGTADDEMDSGNERYTSNSPNLPNKPRRNSSSRARSTSDLDNSVRTDALHSQTNEHPYTKAQLMRIYAANEGLLDDNISHDSVHMFGSEGGGEADGDLDINNLIYQKINDLEDDEESTTIMDDDASTTYSKGRGTVLTGSVSNIDNIILQANDREDPLNYPDSRKGWIPPAGRPMEEAIDEITATSSFASQEEPLPRRHAYDMGGFSHSQGASLYNPSATQESFIGIQQPPKLFHNKRLHDYSRSYYPEDHQGRIAREHEQERPRYRYGSATVLPEYTHRSGHRQHYRSQDLAPPYSKYSPFIPGGRRPMGPHHHPHAYMTPTEGTDGTVTPQTALTGDYHYLSSSSTSLTSTNVSGNLSQPSRQPPIYH